MYQISVEQHIDAAHFLRGYQGKCEALHGHRFRVVVKITAPEVNNIGIGYDFVELKQHLRDVLVRFDHLCLNDLPPFVKMNSSSATIAATLYTVLQF